MPKPRPGPALVPRLRIVQAGKPPFGPGKAELLEYIAATGSIRTAAQEIGMSYPRAWSLVREMNNLFVGPLVTRTRGGGSGGGAELTLLGGKVLLAYTRMEQACADATRDEWRMLQGLLKA
jgi:molybdate transport system regulatory protein